MNIKEMGLFTNAVTFTSEIRRPHFPLETFLLGRNSQQDLNEKNGLFYYFINVGLCKHCLSFRCKCNTRPETKQSNISLTGRALAKTRVGFISGTTSVIG